MQKATFVRAIGQSYHFRPLLAANIMLQDVLCVNRLEESLLEVLSFDQLQSIYPLHAFGWWCLTVVPRKYAPPYAVERVYQRQSAQPLCSPCTCVDSLVLCLNPSLLCMQAVSLLPVPVWVVNPTESCASVVHLADRYIFCPEAAVNTLPTMVQKGRPRSFSPPAASSLFPLDSPTVGSGQHLDHVLRLPQGVERVYLQYGQVLPHFGFRQLV